MPSKPPDSGTGKTTSALKDDSELPPSSPVPSRDVSTGTPHPDWTELLSAFARAEVRYLLVGGYAVSHHAEPRFTADMDLFYSGDTDNVHRLRSALVEWAGLEAIRPLVLDRPRSIVFLGREPWRVDLINFVDGLDFEEAWARREATSYGGVPVPVVDRDSLIASKRALLRKDRPPRKRLQDQADLLALEDSRPPS